MDQVLSFKSLEKQGLALNTDTDPDELMTRSASAFEHARALGHGRFRENTSYYLNSLYKASALLPRG